MLASAWLEAVLLRLPTLGRRLDTRLALQSIEDVDSDRLSPDSAWVLAELELMLGAQYAGSGSGPSGSS